MFLLVGGDSEIAAVTFRLLKERGQAVAATTRRRDRITSERPFLDLAAPLDNWEPPSGTRAVCIFAAVARLAACAADPAGSTHINVTQTLTLCERLFAHGIYVLFLSTNQVFDGETANVAPDAPHSPVSAYGRQKAQTEAALLGQMAAGAPIAILRLAKVVSPDMPLVRDWAETLAAGQPIRAFLDMKLAPTPTAMVAEAITKLMDQRAKGIYQLTGPRDIPYVEMARFIAGRIGANPALVTETTAAEAGLPEGAAPQHTTLDSSLLRDRHGLVVPDVALVMDEVITATVQARP